MSLRKSSSSRNGSKSDVLPKPNARRRCTPAPSRVGLALMSRLTGRMDIVFSNGTKESRSRSHSTLASIPTSARARPGAVLGNQGVHLGNRVGRERGDSTDSQIGVRAKTFQDRRNAPRVSLVMNRR